MKIENPRSTRGNVPLKIRECITASPIQKSRPRDKRQCDEPSTLQQAAVETDEFDQICIDLLSFKNSLFCSMLGEINHLQSEIHRREVKLQRAEHGIGLLQREVVRQRQQLEANKQDTASSTVSFTGDM